MQAYKSQNSHNQLLQNIACQLNAFTLDDPSESVPMSLEVKMQMSAQAAQAREMTMAPATNSETMTYDS